MTASPPATSTSRPADQPGNRARALRRALWVDRETSRGFVVAATVAYFALMVVAHVFHENWRDEVHCWIVGNHATGLWDLLTGIRRYDGHPFLWYEVLHLASRLSPSVVGLHVVTVVLATAAAFLWLAFAPFPRLLRLMGLVSYFLVFEYTVLCRGYVLGLFLLFSFTSLYDRQAPRHLSLFTLLGLLAATSVYGTIIAGSLALFLILQETRAWKDHGAFSSGVTRRRTGLFAAGLATFCAAVVVVAVTTIPPKDAWFASTWHTDLGFRHFLDALLRWWIAMFPVPQNLRGWEIVPTGLGLVLPRFVRLLPWLAAAALLLCLAGMLDTWPAAVAYACVVILMSLFQETRNLGDVRHWGHFFVALLACLWLAHQPRPDSARHSRRRLITHLAFGALLLVHDVTGIVILQSDFIRPFSGSREAAAFIERAGLRDAAFVGSQDHLASAVTGMLDRPFASGNNGEVGYSVVFHNRRSPVNAPETFRLARRFIAENSTRPVVLIMSWDIPAAAVPADLHMVKLTETRRALHGEEMYRIYKVVPAAPPAPGPANRHY